jgi:hypothetical protein
MAPKNTPKQPGGNAPLEDQATTERTTRRAEASSRTRRDQRKIEYEKQQRQWFWTKIAIGALAVVFLVFGGFRAWQWYEEWQVSRDVETYFGASDFAATHNDAEPVLYEQIPPVGGYHRNAWQNCGFYSAYINNENGVHALEHGAVWITYDPNLSADEIDILRDKAESSSKILVSPYPGMDAPVIASVWGKQIKLDGANDDRLDPFISRYLNNPGNTPEIGGICWSGVSATTDVEPQQDPYVRPEGSDPVGGIPASTATAIAATENPQTIGTPPAVVATPGASPEDDPEGSPVGSGADTITD